MSSWLAWFLFDWHWLVPILGAAAIFAVVGLVVYFMAGEGDRDEVARFDAYLDDVEDGYIDLPGPAGARPLITAGDGTRPAGELHYMDTWLGRPGDGSEHTALRVRREGEAMLARVEAARRELAAECGIRYVPMELVAA